MTPRERGRNQTLCYGKCWSKLLLTKQTFDLFFSQSCEMKSEFSYIICSYLRRLVIQNSLKCTETLHIFFDPLPNPIGIFFINCDLFIELLLTDLSTLIPLQLENRLWTTVVLFHCCTLIWGLTNNNYNLYLLQFMTVSVNIHSCYICIP
jgi:hypothetical protein